jgi:16S rRNA processing protein RimM
MQASDGDSLEVGRITGAYGIKGWIKVQPYSGEARSEPIGLLHGKTWWLGREAGEAKAYAVEEVRLHSGNVVAKLAEVPDRNAAEALKGLSVRVARQELPPAGPDEYYWVDLIGCAVTGANGDLLGVVKSVDDNGAHAILEVEDPGQGEGSGKVLRHAIPFVNAYVKEVDLPARRIATEWLASYSE